MLSQSQTKTLNTHPMLQLCSPTESSQSHAFSTSASRRNRLHSSLKLQIKLSARRNLTKTSPHVQNDPSRLRIISMSYIAAQLYEYTYGSSFRAITRETAALQTFTFAHLSADCILCRLPGRFELSPDRRTLTAVDGVCSEIWKSLNGASVKPLVLDPVKELIKSR